VLQVLISALIAFGTPNIKTSLPNCRYDDIPATHGTYELWQKTLLDPIYTLSPDYVPTDLTSLSEIGLSGKHLVRRLVIEDLVALLEAANAAGTLLEVQSAYRSYDYQADTFTYWVEQEGSDSALRSSAKAGHSEHQLGTTIDFRSAAGPAPWDVSDWGTTPEGSWLSSNSWRFGFVKSYDHGQEAETCYNYEPWHYRYLGRDLAKKFVESEQSLRAWLWQEGAEQ
jgi:D-alanyl-D-alanine carboxypeptidase